MKYFITVESKEYNPIESKWENKRFSGEFEGENEKDAKTEAKEIYAAELSTEPNEIKIIKCNSIQKSM